MLHYPGSLNCLNPEPQLLLNPGHLARGLSLLPAHSARGLDICPAARQLGLGVAGGCLRQGQECGGQGGGTRRQRERAMGGYAAQGRKRRIVGQWGGIGAQSGHRASGGRGSRAGERQGAAVGNRGGGEGWGLAAHRLAVLWGTVRGPGTCPAAPQHGPGAAGRYLWQRAEGSGAEDGEGGAGGGQQ